MKRLLLAALAFAPLCVWGSGYFGVGGGGGGVPTGPAGGVLSGTYPNPSFAVDRVRIVGDTMTGSLKVNGTVLATKDIQAGLAGVSSGTLATCTSGGSNCGSFAQVTNGESRLVGPAALTLYSGGNERLAFSSGGVPTVQLPYSWPFVVRTGDTMTGRLGVPSPLAGIDAANKAYVDAAIAGVSVNISGSPNTLTYFTSSAALASAPHWGMSDEGKMSWSDTFVSGVTVNDGVDIGLYGNFQSGSVNSNRTFVRMNPTYESGSALNSLQGLNYAPSINTPFLNQTIFDVAPYYGPDADFSNTTVFNVHDYFDGGSQAINGYVGYGVDITVSSAAYVNGYSAFQDNSDFLEGASVGSTTNILSFASNPQIGVTVGGYFGMNIWANLNQGAHLDNAYGFSSNLNVYPGAYVNNFVGVNSGNGFQAGSTVNFFTGVNNTPNFATPILSYRGYNEGPSFQSGSSVVNPVIVDLHPYWQAGSTMDGNLLGININPAWDPAATLAGTSSATLLNVNPGFAGIGFNSFTGADINLSNVTGAQQVTGLNINVWGITTAGGIAAYGINQNGGFLQSNYQSIWPDVGFFQFNYVGGQATVPAGQPVTSGFAFGINLASGLHAEANVGDDGMGLNLGFADVGFVGSMEILSGVTVDAVTMALGGAGVPAGSTGGTIEDAAMFSAAGILPQGGTVNVTNMKGFRAMPTLCVVASGTCRGLSIEDPAASNYLASTVTLDGLTANRVAILDGTKTVAASSVTDTELGYLSGATANIQTQINSISGANPAVETPGDADYTILPGDRFVRTGVALTATRTYTLPACTGSNIGEVHYVKKSVASGSDLSLALDGADTLDGATGPFTIMSQDSQNVFCAESTKWENF